MIETVIAVEDIKKLYGDEFELHERLEQGNVKDKMGYEFLDEYLPVTLVKKIGPFSTIHIKGQGHRRFIMPSELVLQRDLPSTLELYKPILDKYFPSRWWYHLNYNKLYLYYPELEITNSMGLRHTIYDLVVRFDYNSDQGKLSNMCGKRYSFTEEELVSGYIHSHLPEFNGTNEDGDDDALSFQGFCTGGASHFTRLLESMNKRNSSKELELFLVQLGEYLNWESIEGRPFISIVDISSSKVDNSTWSDPIQYPLRFKIAKFVIEEFNKHQIIPVLLNIMGAYILDISRDPQWFYTNIEKLIVEKFSNELDLADWDDKRQAYIGGRSENPAALWDLDDYDDGIIKELDITPRVIKKEVEENISLVKRLTTNMVAEITQEVTNILTKGLVKQIKTIDG